MKNELNGKLIAAVRIRGSVNVRSDILETLDRLHLGRPNNCALIKMSPSFMGMINKCTGYIAYGEIEEDILKQIVDKHELKADPKELLAGKVDMKLLAESFPIRLHPPRKGYRSTKLGFKQGGNLGYMGPAINGLIKRMV
jgi:large subunit ribosomal protein L30